MRVVITAVSYFVIGGLLLGQAALIVWYTFGYEFTLTGMIATLVAAGLAGVVFALWRGEFGEADAEQSIGPLPGWTIGPVVIVAGLIPFTLLGGWGEAGDTSVWPWIAGFGTQAVVAVGLIVWAGRSTS